MLTTNRVARLVAVGRMEVTVEEVPEPSSEEMLIKVEAAGICGSDLHYYRHGGLGSFKQPLPMNMGHEPAGTVVDPNGHPDFAVGDRVAIEPGRPCLSSPWSLRGRHNLCKAGRFMGAMGHPGCFSDYVCVAPLQCKKLPPSISFEAAALLEPVCVALHCVSLVEAKFSDTVTIFGAGAIGLCCLLMLRRLGISTIFVVEPLPHRRRIAEELGASAALPPGGAVAEIKRRTAGLGCSVVLDAAGNDMSLESSLQAAAVGGTFGLLAIPECDHLRYNPHQARTKELRVVNLHRSRLLLAEAVELFSDPSAQEALRRLVTHRLPLSDVDTAFRLAADYTDEAVKVMLRPSLPAPREVRRIGLLGAGVHCTREYVEALRRDGGTEVIFAARLAGESEDLAFEEVCRSLGVKHLGVVSPPLASDMPAAAACAPHAGRGDRSLVAENMRDGTTLGGACSTASSPCHSGSGAELERIAALGCDIVLVGPRAAASVDMAFLHGIASVGVISTHLGLQPANMDFSDPVMWAMLCGLPQGCTTYFAAMPASDSPSSSPLPPSATRASASSDEPHVGTGSIIDIFELATADSSGDDGRSSNGSSSRPGDDARCCSPAAVRERLISEAVRRVPCWLAALRSGVFDMSAMRTIRRARRIAEGARSSVNQRPPALDSAPNGAFVSWRWRCAFIKRFSSVLGDRVRTRLLHRAGAATATTGNDPADDGALGANVDGSEDFYFAVIKASPLEPLDALPPEGCVLSAAPDGSSFVVRAADGLVTCRALTVARKVHAGAAFAPSPPGDGPAGGFRIPDDFPGEAWTVQESPLIPAGYPAVADPLPQSSAAAPGQAPDAMMFCAAASSASPARDCVSDATIPLSDSGKVCVDRKVPIFDLRFEDDFVTEFQLKAADVLSSGRPLSESRYCREFEAAFSKLVHAPHAIVTSSGTMALSIALRAIGVKSKAVIAPSNTFFATQVAVENAGGRCIFGECDPVFMQLCPRALGRQLAQLPPGSVAAVIVVHIGGIIAPFAKELLEVAHLHGAALVEDAAHAHTSHLDGVGWAGTIGDIAAFSFFPTKVMTTGEGGVITTAREDLHRACQQIKQFGADLAGGASRFTCARADGVNGRVPEMSALLGVLECNRICQRVAQRQRLVQEYVRGLAGCSAYSVLQQPGGSCSYYKCIVKLRAGFDREALRAYAKGRGIGFTGEVYFLGVHRMPAYAPEHPEPLPVTDSACEGHVCPPLYPELTVEDVGYVCSVMCEFAAAAEVNEGTASAGHVEGPAAKRIREAETLEWPSAPRI